MKISWIIDHRPNAGIPSVRSPVSKDMISASLELCETAPCFLHNQDKGTKVRLPHRQRYDPDVDFESPKSPAKLASENKPSQQSSGWSPTKHNWTLS